MPTSISNLWVPDIWVQGIAERIRTLPSLVSSGVVVRTPEFDAFATGAGNTVNLPYFRDITDQADAPQVENTAPSMQALSSGKQIAVMLNRETGNDITALSKQISGADPVAAILDRLAIRRQKQRQTTLVNILRGAFKTAIAANQTNAFTEDGNNAVSANHSITNTRVIDATAKLGELNDFAGGGILMHPNMRAALLKQDEIAFQRYSEGKLTVETYKGLRVFVSNQLVRAGTTSGSVYDTYIFAPGTVAWGEKPQAADAIEVASLSYFKDTKLNVENIFDRTRFLIHPNGLRWVGTPAGQSPTNAELVTAANWTLDYATADRVSIVQINTNL